MKKIIAVFAVVLAVCVFCLSVAPSYASTRSYFPSVDVRDVSHVEWDLEMLQLSAMFYTNAESRISLDSNAMADTYITLLLQVKEVNPTTGATHKLYLKNMGKFNANENVRLDFTLDDVLSFRYGYEFTFIVQAPGGNYYTLSRDTKTASYLGYMSQVYEFGEPFYSIPKNDGPTSDYYTIINGNTVVWIGNMTSAEAHVRYGEKVFPTISQAQADIKP